MATKNISITESAYNKLARLKGENESFSIVIERIAGKERSNLRDLHGILSKKLGASLENSIIEMRKKDEILHKKRLKEMENMFS